MLRPQRDGDDPNERADAFIAYLAEDRDIVVFPILEIFRDLGTYSCELQLRPGKSLPDLVELGFQLGRFGILIVSPRLLMRYFPPGELDAVAGMEVDGERVILPLWYRVTESQVRARSEVLADLPAAKWSDGVAAATEVLWRRLFPLVPALRTEPEIDLQPATSVQDVLDALRNVRARRFVFDDPNNEFDDALIKGFRVLLAGWIVTVEAGYPAAEAVMTEAFSMVFNDLNNVACRVFVGRIEESAPGADPREIRPLGVVAVGRMDMAAASVIGDWVMIHR